MSEKRGASQQKTRPKERHNSVSEQLAKPDTEEGGDSLHTM